jgi:hypothetical protein
VGGGVQIERGIKRVRKVYKKRRDVKRDKCIPHDPTSLRAKQEDCGWKWIDCSKQDERRSRVDFFNNFHFIFLV